MMIINNTLLLTRIDNCYSSTHTVLDTFFASEAEGFDQEYFPDAPVYFQNR